MTYAQHLLEDASHRRSLSQKLLEALAFMMGPRDDPDEVFVNPTDSELRSIVRKSHRLGSQPDIRFIVDARAERLYIWDAFTFTHNMVLRQLHLSPVDPWIFLGAGSIRSYDIFLDQFSVKRSLLDYDLSFLDSSQLVGLRDYISNHWQYASPLPQWL